ncbi:hypothetical protein [Latilactobacillus sakei]|uniref:hypothetical protein n=1 Tax=Latilactobacillus sakei TaxID=1599 RepID=UPI00202F3249|nr:hypothetical protein [Latilactobacillus sakei]MCM1636638.1 hypothetical protein [Latilactobacillus sakei]USF97689.1 hypothetical protein A4W81_01640 [Latilactobacillus sakei]
MLIWTIVLFILALISIILSFLKPFKRNRHLRTILFIIALFCLVFSWMSYSRLSTKKESSHHSEQVSTTKKKKTTKTSSIQKSSSEKENAKSQSFETNNTLESNDSNTNSSAITSEKNSSSSTNKQNTSSTSSSITSSSNNNSNSSSNSHNASNATAVAKETFENKVSVTISDAKLILTPQNPELITQLSRIASHNQEPHNFDTTKDKITTLSQNFPTYTITLINPQDNQPLYAMKDGKVTTDHIYG